jgi:hypothetical protein
MRPRNKSAVCGMRLVAPHLPNSLRVTVAPLPSAPRMHLKRGVRTSVGVQSIHLTIMRIRAVGALRISRIVFMTDTHPHPRRKSRSVACVRQVAGRKTGLITRAERLVHDRPNLDSSALPIRLTSRKALTPDDTRMRAGRAVLRLSASVPTIFGDARGGGRNILPVRLCGGVTTRPCREGARTIRNPPGASIPRSWRGIGYAGARARANTGVGMTIRLGVRGRAGWSGSLSERSI